MTTDNRISRRRVAGHLKRRWIRLVILALAAVFGFLAMALALTGNTGAAVASIAGLVLVSMGYTFILNRLLTVKLNASTIRQARQVILEQERRGRLIAARRAKAARDARYVFPVSPTDAESTPRLSARVGVILDEFSERAFGYEWHQIRLSPTDWGQQLNDEKLDLVFVESAWAGNGGLWQYHLAGQSAPRAALVELLSEARRRGIPTVFWNKEDPPHYQDFLATARLFDFVFTSDGNKIPEYQRDLGHNRVATLAFAAQPVLHNPARIPGVIRDRFVAFGGMYFKHKYPERREQMDYLLPAAASIGLDIYSRQLGGHENYQFPSPLDSHVRGSLPYDQMVSAYHAYKVFINVNSVVDSDTMCARRVFEITASGAAVVSAPSPAINRFFPGGEITVAADEPAATAAMRALTRSDEYRDRIVHSGQRQIWDHHTYAHRTRQILAAVGVAGKHLPTPLISVVVPTIRVHQIDHILETVAKQAGVNVELILLLHGLDITEDVVMEKARVLGIRRLTILRQPRSVSLGACLNLMVDASTGDFIAKMDDDDLYGEHYLHDLLNAQMFSRAGLVGKAATYFYFAERDATVLIAGAHEHSFGTFVRGATLFGPRKTFTDVRFRELRSSEDTNFLRDYLATGGRIYAADRFNFAVMRSGDGTGHTWDVTDAELFSKGELKFFGNPETSVFV